MANALVGTIETRRCALTILSGGHTNGWQAASQPVCFVRSHSKLPIDKFSLIKQNSRQPTVVVSGGEWTRTRARSGHSHLLHAS